MNRLRRYETNEGGASAEVHVRWTRAGVWGVFAAEDGDAIFEHDSETYAELAAVEYAVRRGSAVVVHDRYGRTRRAMLRPTPALQPLLRRAPRHP